MAVKVTPVKAQAKLSNTEAMIADMTRDAAKWASEANTQALAAERATVSATQYVAYSVLCAYVALAASGKGVAPIGQLTSGAGQQFSREGRAFFKANFYDLIGRKAPSKPKDDQVNGDDAHNTYRDALAFDKALDRGINLAVMLCITWTGGKNITFRDPADVLPMFRTDVKPACWMVPLDRVISKGAEPVGALKAYVADYLKGAAKGATALVPLDERKWNEAKGDTWNAFTADGTRLVTVASTWTVLDKATGQEVAVIPPAEPQRKSADKRGAQAGNGTSGGGQGKKGAAAKNAPGTERAPAPAMTGATANVTNDPGMTGSTPRAGDSNTVASVASDVEWSRACASMVLTFQARLNHVNAKPEGMLPWYALPTPEREMLKIAQRMLQLAFDAQAKDDPNFMAEAKAQHLIGHIASKPVPETKADAPAPDADTTETQVAKVKAKGLGRKASLVAQAAKSGRKNPRKAA